jgi:hypothetical protein
LRDSFRLPRWFHRSYKPLRHRLHLPAVGGDVPRPILSSPPGGDWPPTPPPPLPPARLGGLPEPGAQAPQRARSGTPGAPGARWMNIIYMLEGGGARNPPPPSLLVFPRGKEKSSGVERRFFLGLLRSAYGSPPGASTVKKRAPCGVPKFTPDSPPGNPSPTEEESGRIVVVPPSPAPSGSRASGTDEESGVRGPQGLPTQKPPCPPAGALGPGAGPPRSSPPEESRAPPSRRDEAPGPGRDSRIQFRLPDPIEFGIETRNS